MPTYQFGVLGTLGGALGLVQSADLENLGERATAKNGVGTTVAQAAYDPHKTVSQTVVWDTTTPLPVHGETIVKTGAGAGSYSCDGSSLSEGNTKFAEATIKGILYPSATSYTTTTTTTTAGA